MNIEAPRAGKMLSRAFFARDTETVARELLGKALCRQCESRVERYFLTETEAYIGPQDKACHAFGNRRTKRTEVLYGPPGYYYIYLCYGVHWLLNIVTERKEYPAAVLIRGVGPWDGPGKLTKALDLDNAINRQPATRTSGLWVEDVGVTPLREAITAGPRIGVDYAGPEWAQAPLRFVWRNGSGH